MNLCSFPLVFLIGYELVLARCLVKVGWDRLLASSYLVSCWSWGVHVPV